MPKLTKYFFLVGLFFSVVSRIFSQTSEPAPTPPTNQTSVSAATSGSRSVEIESGNNENFSLVHFGDLIDVDVVGSAEHDWRGSLNPEGAIDGIAAIEEPIYALCRSEKEIAEEIVRSLGKFLRDPIVNVKILDRNGRPYASITGAVRTPQRFRILRNVRLTEILVLSGGLKDRTSDEIEIMRPPNVSCRSASTDKGSMVSRLSDSTRERFVRRASQGGTTFLKVRIGDLLKGKPDANPIIFSGDVITVLSTEPIYVIGGVANPRTLSARAPLTISRAIASAGGFAKDADRTKIVVYRRTEKTTQVLQFNYDEIEAKTLKDIELRGFDILEVGRSGSTPRKSAPFLQVQDLAEQDTNSLPIRTIE